MLYGRYAVDLYIVDLGSELRAPVFLAPDYRTDIRSVYADDTMVNLRSLEKTPLLVENHIAGSDTLVLLCVKRYQTSCDLNIY